MINEQECWLRTKEAAKYLGFATKTLANWRTEGTGPNYRILHSTCFYLREDLDDYRSKKAKDVLTVYDSTGINFAAY